MGIEQVYILCAHIDFTINTTNSNVQDELENQ